MQNAKVGQSISSRAAARHIAYRLSLALLIAVFLASGRTAQAQVTCMGICEQNLEACIRNGGGSSLAPTCVEVYEACISACVAGAASLIG
jgi:hypothetical protein